MADIFDTVKQEADKMIIPIKLLMEIMTRGRDIAHILFDAVKTGDVEKVKTFIRDNPDAVNSRDKIVNLPISNGVEINAMDKGCETPLHYACRYGYLEIVNLLISKGADVNAKCLWGYTPLHEACLNSHLEIVNLLIARGANLSIENGSNQTAYDVAKNFKIRRILKDAIQIAECVSASARGDIAAVERLLRDAPHDGRTPLMVASAAGQVDVVRLFLERGADARIKDQKGQNSFDLANDPLVFCRLVDNCPSLLTIKPSISYIRSFFSDDLDPPYERIAKNSDAHLALSVLFNGLSSNASLSSATYRLHLCGEGLSGKSCLYAQLRSVLARNSIVSQSAAPKDVTKHLRDDMDDRDIDAAMRGKYKVVIDHGHSGRTKGIRISTIKSQAHRGAQIIMYDYGGQREFLINHGSFLSAEESVYVIVLPLWNRKVDESYEDNDIVARYSFWLRFIHSVVKHKEKRCSLASRIPIVTVINRFDNDSNLCRCGRNDVQLRMLIGELSSEFAHFRRHFVAVSSGGVSSCLLDCCIVVNCDVADGAEALIEPLQIAMNHLRQQRNTTYPVAGMVRNDIDGKRDWKLVMKHTEWIERASTFLVHSFHEINELHDERVRDCVLDILLRKALESLLQSGAMLKLPQLSDDGDALYVTSPNELTNKILGMFLHKMSKDIEEFDGNVTDAVSEIVRKIQKMFDAIVSSLNLKGLISIDILRSVGLAVPLSHRPTNEDVQNGDVHNATLMSDKSDVYYVVHGLLTNEMAADAAKPFHGATRILMREFRVSNAHTDMFYPGYFAALFRGVLRLESDWTVKIWKNGINLQTSKSHQSLNSQFDVQVNISPAGNIEAVFRVMIATNEQKIHDPDYALRLMGKVREIIFSGICGRLSVTEFCKSLPVDVVELRMIANQCTSNRHYHRLFCGKYPDETLTRYDMAELFNAQGQMLLDQYKSGVEAMLNSNENNTRYLDVLLHKLFRASIEELREGEDRTLNAITHLVRDQSEESRRKLAGIIEDKVQSVINEFRLSSAVISRIDQSIDVMSGQLAEIPDTHDLSQLLDSVVARAMNAFEQSIGSHFDSSHAEFDRISRHIQSMRTRLDDNNEIILTEVQTHISKMAQGLLKEIELINSSMQQDNRETSKSLEQLHGQLSDLEKLMKGVMTSEDAEKVLKGALLNQLRDEMSDMMYSLVSESSDRMRDIADDMVMELEKKLQSLEKNLISQGSNCIQSAMNGIKSDIVGIRDTMERAESAQCDILAAITFNSGATHSSVKGIVASELQNYMTSSDARYQQIFDMLTEQASSLQAVRTMQENILYAAHDMPLLWVVAKVQKTIFNTEYHIQCICSVCGQMVRGGLTENKQREMGYYELKVSKKWVKRCLKALRVTLQVLEILGRIGGVPVPPFSSIAEALGGPILTEQQQQHLQSSLETLDSAKDRIEHVNRYLGGVLEGVGDAAGAMIGEVADENEDPPPLHHTTISLFYVSEIRSLLKLLGANIPPRYCGLKPVKHPDGSIVWVCEASFGENPNACRDKFLNLGKEGLLYYPSFE